MIFLRQDAGRQRRRAACRDAGRAVLCGRTHGTAMSVAPAEQVREVCLAAERARVAVRQGLRVTGPAECRPARGARSRGGTRRSMGCLEAGPGPGRRRRNARPARRIRNRGCRSRRAGGRQVADPDGDDVQEETGLRVGRGAGRLGERDRVGGAVDVERGPVRRRRGRPRAIGDAAGVHDAGRGQDGDLGLPARAASPTAPGRPSGAGRDRQVAEPMLGIRRQSARHARRKGSPGFRKGARAAHARGATGTACTMAWVPYSSRCKRP